MLYEIRVLLQIVVVGVCIIRPRGCGQSQRLVRLIANIILLASATPCSLMRQLGGVCISYLDEDTIEEFKRKQRNDDEYHANRHTDVYKDAHIAVEHGE